MSTQTYTLCSTPREHMLNAVFTCALEGGVGYWSECRLYRWSDGNWDDPKEINEFRAEIHETEPPFEKDEWLVIDQAVIERGIDLAWTWACGPGDIDGYQLKALRDLKFGHYDEVDYDSITADIVVQHGLYGEVIFG